MFKRIKTVMKIEKMSCKHCSNKVKLALEEVEGVKKVSVSLEKKEATILSTNPLEKENLKKVIEELGYQVIDIIEG